MSEYGLTGYVYNGVMYGSFCPKYDASDKDFNSNIIYRYLLNRTLRMFKWENLPETISQRQLELILQTVGYAGIAETKEGLYALFGTLGGVPDGNYMPTDFIVANPYLNLNKTLKINKDCIVIPNDTTYMGLKPLIGKYSRMMAENELTINIVDIMSRSMIAIVAEDGREAESVQNYFDDLEHGSLKTIISDRLTKQDAVQVQPGAAASSAILTNLIELQQYLKASFYNEIGLNANWNAKRETLTSSETLLNSDTLLPLIDDMKYQRQYWAEKVNAMFGTNISVDFDSAWLSNEKEMEIQEKMMENEANGDKEGESDGTTTESEHTN